MVYVNENENENKKKTRKEVNTKWAPSERQQIPSLPPPSIEIDWIKWNVMVVFRYKQLHQKNTHSTHNSYTICVVLCL